MADGVSVKNITVMSSDIESTKLMVQIEVQCESELEAIGWLVSKLEEK